VGGRPRRLHGARRRNPVSCAWHELHPHDIWIGFATGKCRARLGCRRSARGRGARNDRSNSFNSSPRSTSIRAGRRLLPQCAPGNPRQPDRCDHPVQHAGLCAGDPARRGSGVPGAGCRQQFGAHRPASRLPHLQTCGGGLAGVVALGDCERAGRRPVLGIWFVAAARPEPRRVAVHGFPDRRLHGRRRHYRLRHLSAGLLLQSVRHHVADRGLVGPAGRHPARHLRRAGGALDGGCRGPCPDVRPDSCRIAASAVRKSGPRQQPASSEGIGGGSQYRQVPIPGLGQS
jgi:hypothetical protein